MNEWAELVTSWSRGTTVYDVYQYAFSRLLSSGVVERIMYVDTAATCRSLATTVASDATPCQDSLTDGCPQQTLVSAVQCLHVLYCILRVLTSLQFCIHLYCMALVCKCEQNSQRLF